MLFQDHLRVWSAYRRVSSIIILAGALVAVSQARAQVSAVGAPLPGAPMGVTAFIGVTVVPMDTERILTDQTVLVEGGRITALSQASQVPVPAGAIQINARGKYLIPGLADMHVHLRTDGLNVVDSVAEHGLFRYLASGVTMIRILDYWENDGGASLRLKARAAAGELWGPQIRTAGYWPGQGRQFGRALPYSTHRDSVTLALAAYKTAGYDLIKLHGEYEDSLAAATIVAAARQIGLPVVGHVPIVAGMREGRKAARHLAIEQALTLGYNSIEHLTGYTMPAGEPAESFGDPPLDAARLHALAVATRRAGIWNCPTLTISALSGNPDMPARTQLVKALQDAGAGLLLGTDMLISRFKDPGAAVFLELYALVQAGLTPYQALLSGTRNAAAFFGTLDESGTIAAGKRADLVLLDGNPLQNIGHIQRLAGVMIGGRWLAKADIDRRSTAHPVGR